MKLLLIYPPFADPTQPYAALPLLKSYLTARGFDVKLIDLNIAAIHYVLHNLPQWQVKVQALYHQFNSKLSLTLIEQLHFLKLEEAMRILERLNTNTEKLFAVFSDKKAFYQYPLYYQATRDAEKIFQVLNSLFFPYQYGFNQAGHFLLPWSWSMLESYCTSGASPLADFYTEFFTDALLKDVDTIGISLTFISQFGESFYLSRFLKQRAPDKYLLMGGPCISQVLHCSPHNIRPNLFTWVDSVCIGEGEETLEALLKLPIKERIHSNAAFAAIPNLAALYEGRFYHNPLKPFDIRNAVMPDFSDYNLDAYLAPERLLMYAPTRCCYWHKCSFCTYGFSYAKQYKYQEIPVEKVVAELAQLSSQHKVRNFYFSCDVLAPQYAVRLAEEIIKKKLQIHWSVDLRIEAVYTPAICKLLYASGLRSVAFGIESGSDAMLELINKGNTALVMRDINRIFHKAGIATQWMTFTYHPGERDEDALQTLKLIKQEFEVVDLFVAGEFQLMPGSRVMAEPQKFGIDHIYYLRGDGFRLYPLYTVAEPDTASTASRESIDSRIEQLAENYALNHYPWAGAISTHHSLLYFIHYGQRAFTDRAQAKREIKRTGNPAGRKFAVNFPIKKLEDNRRKFYEFVQHAMLPTGYHPSRGRMRGQKQHEAILGGAYLDFLNLKIKSVNSLQKN